VPNMLVENWFGDEFDNLHPLLQQLHTDGGRLSGDVEISYGKGLAGIIGARLGKKMNLRIKVFINLSLIFPMIMMVCIGVVALIIRHWLNQYLNPLVIFIKVTGWKQLGH